jgi:micrococcal nuclease
MDTVALPTARACRRTATVRIAISPLRSIVSARPIAGLLLAVGAVACMGASASPALGVTLSGTVSRVVDGDTIKVASGGFETPVRLIGIDTPETRHPSKPVQCFGPQASARTARLLPVGRRVRLVTDDTQDRRDRYGRLLTYVYTPGRSGAAGSVNADLVRTGHAKVYVYGGVRFGHASAFFREQHRARRAHRGLWGAPCFGDTDRADASARRPAPAAPAGSSRAGCDPNYSGACVPLTSTDLDCADVARPVRVVGADPHRLDGDGDGWGCETY